MKPVTDSAILAQLNAAPAAAPKPVTDPAILAQLEGSDIPPEGPPSATKKTITNLVGSGDALLHLTSAVPAGLAGGLTYLATLAASGDENAAKAVQEATQAGFTYAPRTDEGKRKSDVVEGALALPAKAGDFVGKHVAAAAQPIVGDEAGAALGAAANVAVQAIPQAVLGKGIGAVAKGATGAVAAGLEKYQPGMKLTSEARRLRAEGVDTTPGQNKPRGILKHLEDTWSHVGFIGPFIKGAKHNALVTAQRAIVEKYGSAPGTKLPEHMDDVNDMLNHADASFRPLYKQAEGHMVPHTVVPALANTFLSATSNRGTMASPAARSMAQDYLDNQIGLLETKFGHPIDSTQLLKLRSTIRAEIRDGKKSVNDDYRTAAKLMEPAEAAVTRALESNIPATAVAALKSADGRYGNFKILEKAIIKAGDNPDGFSPQNLSQAIRQGTAGGAYGKGGGKLRRFAKDLAATIPAKTPPTGAAVPGILTPMAAIAAYKPLALVAAGDAALTLTKTGRRIAAGETGVQRGMQSLAHALGKARGLPPQRPGGAGPVVPGRVVQPRRPSNMPPRGPSPGLGAPAPVPAAPPQAAAGALRPPVGPAQTQRVATPQLSVAPAAAQVPSRGAGGTVPLASVSSFRPQPAFVPKGVKVSSRFAGVPDKPVIKYRPAAPEGLGPQPAPRSPGFISGDPIKPLPPKPNGFINAEPVRPIAEAVAEARNKKTKSKPKAKNAYSSVRKGPKK